MQRLKSTASSSKVFGPSRLNSQSSCGQYSAISDVENGGEKDPSSKGKTDTEDHEFWKGVWSTVHEALGLPRRPKIRRILDRDSTFHQSFGRWNIRRLRDGVPGVSELYSNDQYHTLVNMDTSAIIALIFCMYLTVVTFFATMYLLISCFDGNGCHLGINSMQEAYYFSLETMTTVGYGAADVFFGGCWSVMLLITVQALCGILIDAALIGLIFTRVSRPQTRASTVVFSRNAIMRRVRGEFYLMFQVGELRKHQLLETHVRCYAMRHDRTLPLDGRPAAQGDDETVYFQTHKMRLQHPDDTLDSSLLLVLPQIVVHRIDAWSPLMPPPRWASANKGVVQWGFHPDGSEVRAPWDLAEAQAPPPESWGQDTDVVESGSPNGSDGSDPLPSAPGGEAPSEGGDRFRPMVKQNSYWEHEFKPRLSLSQAGGLGPLNDANEKGPGYVYRFPDLLKRWDDVDGDRGTWYERMKRRVIDMEQRRTRDQRRRRLREAVERSSPPPEARGKRIKRKRSTIIRISMPEGEEPRPPGSHFSSPPPPLLHKHHSSKHRHPHSRRGSASSGITGNADRDRGAASSPERPPPRSHTRSHAHNAYASPVDDSDCLSTDSTQSMVDPDTWFANEERKAVDAFLRDRELEVVVVVEGTDTSTGALVQSRHSYAYSDMLWDRTFGMCVARGKDGSCVVDFRKFHETVPAPSDCLDFGPIQSFA